MSSNLAWSLADTPDLCGRLAVVTGANSGIGFETAKALASSGADVVLACRNQAKARAAAEAIRPTAAADVQVRELDLASLDSVHTFSQSFLSDFGKLDLLINNAGVMMPPRRTESSDGFELQFGTNHLGHFKLAAQLWPALAGSGNGRVVTVASQAHRLGSIAFDDLNWETRRYKRMASYGQSKLANLLFAFELARRSAAAGSTVRSIAAHPGWTATELQRHSPASRFFNKFFAMNRSDGALPTLRAATDPAAASGDYLGPAGIGELRGPPVPVGTSSKAKSTADAERLWRVSEDLTGLEFSVSTQGAE